MKVHVRRLGLAWIVTLWVALLAACGGGTADDHDSQDAYTAEPPRATALAALGALPNGGFATGSIAAVGASNSHTFTATAGQGLLLSVARSSGTFSPFFAVFGPDGTRLTSTSGALVASLGYTAPTTGTYTVVVQHRSSTGGIGSYQIHYARGAGANEHGALVNGGFKAESITIGDIDSYTFSASAGQGLVLSVARTSGNFSPLYVLYGPDGARITSTSGARVASLGFTAPTTGTYTVAVLNRSDDGSTGGYEIHYARGAGANEHGALVNGGAKSETITVGDVDSYTFSASAGQGLILSVARTSGNFSPLYILYGPDGARITSTSGAVVASLGFRAPTTGTYTVVVLNRSDDASTGTYQIHYARGAGANEHGLLVNGGLKSETITVGDVDSYTFTASAGQGLILSVARTSGTFAPLYILYGPDGARITSTSGARVASLGFTAPTTGTYTVVVLNRSDDGSNGTYEIHYARGAGANEHGLLVNGGARSESITVGDVDSYTFSASAGQGLLLSVARTSGTFSPLYILYGPDGRRLTSTSGALVASLGFTAPTTGTYTVVVLNRSDDGSTGTYEIHYARGAGANELGLLTRGVSKSGTITIGDLDSFTFSGVAGGSVALTVTRTAGLLAPAFVVYGPTGARITSASGSTSASLSLTTATTGVYTLVVFNRSDDGSTGSYLATAN